MKFNIKTEKLMNPFIIILTILLAIGGLVFWYAYYTTFGFTYPDGIEPPRKNFNTLEELVRSSKGKYLIPAYIPGELDPMVYSNVVQTFTKFCQIGSRNANGEFIGFSKPDGWQNSLPDSDYFIGEFGVGVGDDWSTDVTSKVYNCYNEKVKVNETDAGFFQESFITPKFNNIKLSNARLRFIGQSRGENCGYNIGVYYVCINAEKEAEIRGFVKNELIKAAESMISQGLPKNY